jgi:hypothetical protein
MIRRRALLAASGGGELADFYLTLNTTNSENLKVYELFEREYTSSGSLCVWEPTNINVYVSGQAGKATFSNARVTYASRFGVSRMWEVIFEGMDNIGRYAVCWLSDNGALSAFDDD